MPRHHRSIEHCQQFRSTTKYFSYSGRSWYHNRLSAFLQISSRTSKSIPNAAINANLAGKYKNLRIELLVEAVQAMDIAFSLCTDSSQLKSNSTISNALSKLINTLHTNILE